MRYSSVVKSAALIVLVVFCAGSRVAVFANDLGRDRDPVVVPGASVPSLLGVDPSRIVAFRFEGAWLQIPVQVDERAIVDFGTIYNTTPSGYTVLAYADTSTFTGTDPDAAFDSDDELALMAKDAGPVSTAGSEPEGVVSGSGVVLEITDPLSAAAAYAYLFESDGSLSPGAGADSIYYDFNLLSGDYKTTYSTMAGPNPEDSDVATSAYAVHFSDRWIRDETSVLAGGASGEDILDRHKNLFGPGNCARSEDTFSNGEGAFIMNRTGPVRALRGYVGANSGPTTYRFHAFYEEREDIMTALRVHAISGVMDFFDYSPIAAGMTYMNDLNQDGVTIDGVPDVVQAGGIIWEMVTGTQGTLAMSNVFTTDIPDFYYTSYYSDDSTPSVTQCTGDAYEYGASGLWVDHAIPNTDPGAGEYNIFEVTRVIYYAPPDQALPFAVARAEEIHDPLAVDTAPYDPVTGVYYDPDGAAPGGQLRISFWPNPMGGSVNIRFTMREGGPLEVDLYDVSGRLVARLVEGSWGAGSHDVARNLDGLPPGIYFARARGPGGSMRTSRVVILR